MEESDKSDKGDEDIIRYEGSSQQNLRQDDLKEE